MTDETTARLDDVIRHVFDVSGSHICQDCIIKNVVHHCRVEGIRVSRLQAEMRVKFLWDEVDPRDVQ